MLVSRILAGREKITLPAGTFWLLPPTATDRYEAASLAAETEAEGIAEGLLTDDEAHDLLCKNGLWSPELQKELDTCRKNLEQLKVDLYKAAFEARKREVARRLLALTRERQVQLMVIRHQYDYQTASGVAAARRARFVVGRTLFYPNGRRVWPGDSFWNDVSGLLDDAVQAQSRSRPHEADIRELARTDPWRAIWNCRESASGIFNVAACDFTDEQRVLVAWSRLYDNANEDPTCPPPDVVADDDMFDGWLIDRRREREREVRKNRTVSALENEKIAQSGEVFFVGAAPGEATGALSDEDREAIEDLNDAEAKMIKRQRAESLRKYGKFGHESRIEGI